MIAVVFCGDIKFCPYINRYIERLETLQTEYKIYFWNRSGEKLNLPDCYCYFDCYSDLNKEKVGKIKDFFMFRKWLKEKFKQDKIEKVIALSTLTGIFIFDWLLNNKGKYIFDIRDYSYENIPFFYWIEAQIIKKSFFTAISSKGFEKFLPKHDYVVAHNFNIHDKKGNYSFKKNRGPIRIVWNGVMRFFEYQKQYLDALKNDERFQLIYHGDGPDLELYREYCLCNGYNNVVFTGAYDNGNKEILLKNADILNNCYGYMSDAGNRLKYAISNRFYDGIIYHIPQIVEPGGYKTQLVKKYGIGTNIAVDTDFADKLYAFYNDIEKSLFDNACERLFKEIMNEDKNYICNIDRFIIQRN